MAIRRAGGGGLKKRRKKAGQSGLQSGIFEGRAGAYAFGDDPVTAIGAVTDDAGITGVTPGESEYSTWQRENTTRNIQNQYAQALTVNKALTYPEFLSQTYGTQLGGPHQVGRRGHKRAVTTPFNAGNLRQAADPYSFEQYTEEFSPQTAFNVGNTDLYRGSSGASERAIRDTYGDLRDRYLTYKSTVNPAQDWGDFVNGVSTVATPYNPNAYGYHANTGGGAGGKRKRKGKR
jgi:hypothetical protein